MTAKQAKKLSIAAKMAYELEVHSLFVHCLTIIETNALVGNEQAILHYYQDDWEDKLCKLGCCLEELGFYYNVEGKHNLVVIW